MAAVLVWKRSPIAFHFRVPVEVPKCIMMQSWRAHYPDMRHGYTV